ncbi:hypothetical protein [Paracoccus sp. (in: a-proteobacteria)]|uniref:hypothetical protein n=1 Tax=Paracoccus sp. TaxID=267 RepID=UPI002899C2C1|nr:hypothetical protein [Paracoccus sp. (in: a-proteobacteria)]
MATVAVSPDVLEWARERAGVPFDTLTKRFKKYPVWLDGQGGPTFQQLESLANVLHLPMGMFFLPEGSVAQIT